MARGRQPLERRSDEHFVTLFITVNLNWLITLSIIKFQLNMSHAPRVDNRQVKYHDVATLDTLIGEKDQEITGV